MNIIIFQSNITKFEQSYNYCKFSLLPPPPKKKTHTNKQINYEPQLHLPRVPSIQIKIPKLNMSGSDCSLKLCSRIHSCKSSSILDYVLKETYLGKKKFQEPSLVSCYLLRTLYFVTFFLLK